MKILFRILDGCGGLLDRLSGIGIVRGPAFSDKTLLDVKNAFSAGDWRPAANALRAAEGRWQQRGRLFSTIRSAKKPWMAAKSWHETDPNDVDSTLTYGKTLLDWAWHARGGGYANTVSNKAIELFGERLTEALPLLNSAAQAAPNDPAAFDCLMWIGTALGAPRRQVEAWFAEATSRDPWNLAVHHTKLQFLCPKWGGSNDELLRFAEQISVSAPPSNDLQALIPCAHYEIAVPLSEGSEEAETRYWRTKSVADAVILAHRRLLSRDAAADTPERIDSRGAFAYAFWQMGAKQAARDEFAFLGRRLPGLVWSYHLAPARYFKRARALCR